MIEEAFWERLFCGLLGVVVGGVTALLISESQVKSHCTEFGAVKAQGQLFECRPATRVTPSYAVPRT